MKYIQLFTVLTVLCLTSCNRITNTTKDGINKGGEVVGEAATEFFEGVSKGVDHTLDCEIIFSKSLKSKGVSMGVYDIDSHANNKKNQLTLYLIFEQNFEGDLTAKVYNKKNLEIGRAHSTITAKAGDAAYYDFQFDKRTDIGYRNTIVIE